MKYDYVREDGLTISQDTRLDFKSIADAITLLLRDNPELDAIHGGANLAVLEIGSFEIFGRKCVGHIDHLRNSYFT